MIIHNRFSCVKIEVDFTKMIYFIYDWYAILIRVCDPHSVHQEFNSFSSPKIVDTKIRGI